MKLIKTTLLIALTTGAADAANLIYRNVILSENPIAYYEFDETSGITATDSSGNGNDGIFVDTATLGVISGGPNLGTAVDLAGGYVALPDLGTLSQFTLETWVQADTITGLNAILATPWAANGIHFNLKEGAIESSQFNGPFLESGANAIALSQWYHVVASFDSTAPSGDIYINGVAAGTTAASENVTLNSALIGSWDGVRLFDGRMDEFVIYDSALTEQDAAAHYAAATAVVPEPSSVSLLGLAGLSLTLRRRR